MGLRGNPEAFHFARARRNIDVSDLRNADDPEELESAVEHFKSLILQREGRRFDGVQKRIRFSLRAPEPGFEAAIRLVNGFGKMEILTWQKSITRPGRTSWVEINVKGVLRALVALRESPGRDVGSGLITFIERGVCFGAHEPQVSVVVQIEFKDLCH